ncbi:MAG: glutamine--fructose-6-phosphate transaminase (isomerizing) [Ruminococcaceae bacterium]|nr:glutamine--fructose-6-phosphate transaminase (isomerizing) [Oscillospiraceae bacterium]
MCGIVGYVGSKQAAPILLEGLSKLEYRGYDSAGIATRDTENHINIIKSQGRLSSLVERTKKGQLLKGNIGIGHTRWATHGIPSEENAHPHCSNDQNVVLVHNGIIENNKDIRSKLVKNNYTFYSQTDTEALTKLIDYYYKKYGLGPVDAIARTMVRVTGSYAVAVMFKDYPDKIFVARKDSPLVIGTTPKAAFIASDAPAILQHTKDFYYIDNMEIGAVSRDNIVFYNLDGEPVPKEKITLQLDCQSSEKGSFPHFMLKEIHQQPEAISNTIESVFEKDICPIFKNISSIYIIGCGSAYHAGLVAKSFYSQICDLPVFVELASEFRYNRPRLTKDTLVVVISQSGETADTLAALREAKVKGAQTLAIVNVESSSIAREADFVMYTKAGPEISVATTKAYSTQLIVCYQLGLEIALAKSYINENEYNSYLEELKTLPGKIEKILEHKERLQWFASKYSVTKDIFFVGRGLDYAVCMEGSLKMKEISYIHSEAYAAGELKHGTISLIEEGTLVIGVLTQPELYDKTVSNLTEVQSRGAYVMALTSHGNYNIEDVANFTLYIPSTLPCFAASLAIIPLQLMAYYVSVAKGLDVDKPRNLAKSVTVE